MPRLVDYGSRFAFLREAAFEVVLTRGVDALSRQSVAQVQGVSASTVRRLVAADADLVALAADEVVTRRRRGRWRAAGTTDRQRAVELVCGLVPDADDRIDEELVWLRIVLSTRVRPGVRRTPPGEGSLRERYQVAQRGYADAPPVEPDADEADLSADLARVVGERAREVDATLARVVELLGVPASARDRRLVDLRLLVDGVCLAVCTGGLDPGAAVQAIERTADLIDPGDGG